MFGQRFLWLFLIGLLVTLLVLLVVPRGCDTAPDAPRCYVASALARHDPGVCAQMEERGIFETGGWITTGVDANTCYSAVAEANDDPQLCNKIQGGGKRDCITYLAFRHKNVSLCHDLDETLYRNTCIKDVAVALGDVHLCKTMPPDESPVEDTEGECIMDIALAKNNRSLCDQITNPVHLSVCYRDFGERANNSQACTAIPAGEQRAQCYTSYAQKQRNFSLCETELQGDPHNQYGCYLSVAGTTRDPAACSHLPEQTTSGVNARDTCYFVIGINTKNFATCMNITNKTQRATCAGIAGPANPEACDQLPTGYAKDDCYYHAAKANKNIGPCLNMSLNHNLKEDCFQELSANVPPDHYLDYCGTFTDQAIRDICYRTYPVANRTVAVCQRITNATIRDECYSGLTVLHADPAVCELMSGQPAKDSCLWNVALRIQNTDPHVCDQIVDARIKTNCLTKAKQNN